MADHTRMLGIHADYEMAPHMVVFSHGFGVDRTSRGMFTDIVKALPNDYGYVLFDYYEIKDKAVRISTFEDQQRTLLTIIARLSERKDVKDISLVAHSMGCIVAALAQPPELKQVIMLAPPLSVGERTRHYFTTKEGAKRHGDIWTIPRRDGTTSSIPAALFDEIEQIEAAEILLDYATVQPYELLIPTDDEVLGDTDYNDLALDENITALTIDEADHNFSGNSRLHMIEAVVEWLQA